MINASPEYFLAFAREQVLLAGHHALQHFRTTDGWLKDNRTIVTEVDIAVQRQISKAIRSKFPEHAILAEESTDFDQPLKGDEEWVWVLDPIDGTDSFVSGLATWGVSLALFRNREPFIAMFYMPVLCELYHASADGPAMLTIYPGQGGEINRDLHVDPHSDLHPRSLLLVPSDFHRRYTSDFPGKQRTLGSIASHLCVVARGAGVGTIFNVHLWDIAAAGLILRKAEGDMFDLDTCEPLDLTKWVNRDRIPPAIAATSQEMAKRLKSMIFDR